MTNVSVNHCTNPDYRRKICHYTFSIFDNAIGQVSECFGEIYLPTQTDKQETNEILKRKIQKVAWDNYNKGVFETIDFDK